MPLLKRHTTPTTLMLCCYRLFGQVLLPSVVMLRKRYLGFLVLAGGVIEIAGQQQQIDSESGRSANFKNKINQNKMPTIEQQQLKKSPITKLNSSDKLMLYYDCFSFYSQKVVMALHEKHLPFESRLVNLFKNEQYQSWFLKLNTKGEVPVLQDTVRILPDSARIIDYLEDNFSNGETPRLIPIHEGPEVRQKVNNFRQILQEIPAGMLTTGAVLHSNLLKNSRIPFIAPVRQAMANAERDAKKTLETYAEQNPEAREDLLRKAVKREENYNYLCLIDNFKKLLNDIDEVLTKVEDELSQHTDGKQDWWLCSKSFSIADIELTILLERLSQLGLEYRFWLNNKRPHLEKYYERVKGRDSYKKTIPSKLFFFKTLLITQAPISISVITAFAVIAGGVIVAKKYIF